MSLVSCLLVTLTLFASCTAISQQDAFLDSLPRVANNVVFSDDFESGLGKWNQTSGSWVTGTPAPSGLALISPSSAAPANFILSTLNDIDLSGKTNCLLEYDIRYNISGVAGVTAQILFGPNTVASFKEKNTGLAAVSSASFYQRKKYRLPDGNVAKLTVKTDVLNNTTSLADIAMDNIKVTCNNTFATVPNLVTENMEGSAPNWSFNSPLGLVAGQGTAGSQAGGGTLPDAALTYYMTYAPNIDLNGRYGCKLKYYFRVNVPQTNEANCISLDWNNGRIDAPCSTTTSGYRDIMLTPYEGLTANALQFRTSESGVYSGSPFYYVDDVTLTCQQ